MHFWSGQVRIWSGQVDFLANLPEGQVAVKVNVEPCGTPLPWTEHDICVANIGGASAKFH